MKNNISSKIRLGIFISLGIAVFIAAIYFLGEKQQLFSSTFRLTGVFEDVGGLQAGNNVRLSGINVGTVENITMISDTSVRVGILIDSDTRRFIKKDAVATIGSEGLMGNKVLIITPGTGGKKSIENNDVINTAPPINLDDVFISLKSTLDNASSITDYLKTITNNIQSGKGTIGRLIMDQAWRENFDSTFSNLKDGSIGFKTFMEKTSELDTLLRSLNTTVENASNVTLGLAKITTNLESGKGIIGKLLVDNSTSQNFDTTLVNLKNSLAQFEIFIKKAQNSWLLGL